MSDSAWFQVVLVLVGLFIGYQLGFSRGVKACTPRRWKNHRERLELDRRLRLGMSSLGSLGENRRGHGARQSIPRVRA